MSTVEMPARHVDVDFECLPIRSIARWDIPLDASPQFRARCERLKRALSKHGAHNTYYLSSGECRLRLTNHPTEGVLEFAFEGTVMTDADDEHTVGADLDVALNHETCVWLNEPVVAWWKNIVTRAVMVDFDRYIALGDHRLTRTRLALADSEFERHAGFVGMGI